MVTSFDTGAHTNGIEINASRDVVVSNNLIAHLESGTLTLWTAPNQGYTATVFNNVFYDTDINNVVDVARPVNNGGCAGGSTYCNVGGTHLFYNNTIFCGPEAGPAAVCAANIASGVTAVTLQNNHWITNATSPNGGMWSTNGPTPTVTTNHLQSKATATGQGFTSAQPAPFSPTSGASTIAAGTNLTSLCTGVLAGLCYDSAIGVAYDPVTHVVIGPNRQVKSRPGTGAWDVGAYQWATVGAPPSAPTGLRIIF